MIIIDASIANKLFLPNEEGYLGAETIFRRHTQNIEEICVPDLLFYEVVNTLATKTAIPLELVIRSFKNLMQFRLKIFYPSEQHLIKAAKLAKKHKVSVYDAVYAVLAKEKKCLLVTADKKFVEKINLSFVKLLGI